MWDRQKPTKCPYCKKRRVVHDCAPDARNPYTPHCNWCCVKAAKEAGRKRKLYNKEPLK